MTQTRIIGDIHGKWMEYQDLAEQAPQSIQLGDFGYGFRPPQVVEWMEDWWKDTGEVHYFIRGNHDDPKQVKDQRSWLSDGMFFNDNLFVGGAWSIDHAWRTPGVDWWDDEELSIVEWGKIIDAWSMIKPRVMFTHDCPQLVSKRMFVDAGQSLGGSVQHTTRTGQALQMMFELHQPEQWYFGHWHVTKTETIDGTQFTCLGELDYVDIEMDALFQLKLHP